MRSTVLATFHQVFSKLLNLSDGTLTIGTVSYICIVLTIGIWAFARTRRWQEETQFRRERWLVGRRQFEAVSTSTPLDDPAAVAKQRAAENIQRHANATRRLLLPWMVMIMGVLLALPFLDRAPAVFVSLLATAIAVLLGVASKPILENAISGLVLSSSRLVRIGDTVDINGHYGTIEDITATHTTLKIWDWRRFVVPNSQLLQSALINYSLTDRFQWAHVEFYVSFQADIALVRKIALDVAQHSLHFAGYEPPAFWVMETKEHSIRCWVAAWADSPSTAWQLSADIREGLVTAFQKYGILTHQINCTTGGGSLWGSAASSAS